VAPLLAETDYTNFTHYVDFPTWSLLGVHGDGHFGVGGEMLNVWSSINDPLFFMHHAHIDHVWWLWQTQSSQNVNAFGGPIYANGTGTATLDTTISLAPFIARRCRLGRLWTRLIETVRAYCATRMSMILV
jgi:tyrosinase